MGKNKVSIIIPTYNRAHLIGETLDSVIAQTYQNWECIVVDDGSTDNTAKVMEAYMAKDSRIQYYHRPPEHQPGGNGARNYGFIVSRGEYIQWFDSDDLMSPEKVGIQLTQMLSDKTQLSTSQWLELNDKGFGEFRDELFTENISSGLRILEQYGKKKTHLLTTTFIVKRDLIYLSGLWNEWITVNQDGEFFARALINADRVSLVKNNDCYAVYRKQTRNKKKRISSERKAKEYLLGYNLITSQLMLIDEKRFEEFCLYHKYSLHKMLWEEYNYLLPKKKYYFKFFLSRNHKKYLKNKKRIKRSLTKFFRFKKI